MSTYVPIEAITLTQTTASVSFVGIPQTYTDLVLVASAQRGITGSGGASFLVTVNGDTGSNYSSTLMYEGSPYYLGESNATRMSYMGVASDGVKGATVMHFNGYSNTTRFKTVLGRVGESTLSRATVSMWRSTAPITTITMTPISGFASGSTFTLYGIAAGTPKAFGGEVTIAGGYAFHTFRQSGQFLPLEDLTLDYVVVAGGGGAGLAPLGGGAGGGGGGGLRSTITATGGGGSLEAPISVSADSIVTITVGAGGVAGGQTYPSSGADSAISGAGFSTITAVGGGGSANQVGYNAFSGGSGGGGSYQASGGAGTANQGFAGGNGSPSGSPFPGGGGGGAGANGGSGSGSVAGSGGSGVTVSIAGVSTTYAGGGGAGGRSGVTAGSGGSGGGGAGGVTSATSGTANTGGGGGGASDSYPSGAGGSGIVIVRYAI